MNWYKKAQGYIASDMRINYPYYLIEIIKMQPNGLALDSMDFEQLKEAKELEKAGRIKKVIKQDKQGKYTAYEIL